MNLKQILNEIANSKEKMAFYKQDPLAEAFFTAFRNYINSGYSIADVSWFSLAKKSSATH